MNNAPDQMTAYIKALSQLAEAKAARTINNDSLRAALRNAWNLHDGLSREEQAQVSRPDGLPVA